MVEQAVPGYILVSGGCHATCTLAIAARWHHAVVNDVQDWIIAQGYASADGKSSEAFCVKVMTE